MVGIIGNRKWTKGGYLCLSLVEVEIGSNDEDKEVEVSDIPIINVHIDGKVYFESLDFDKRILKDIDIDIDYDCLTNIVIIIKTFQKY